MKTKLAVLILGMLLLSGLVMAGRSLSREHAQPPGQTFAISKLGTLLDVFDANGKSRFGTIDSDGFDVSYKIRNTIFVSAIATKPTGLQATSEQPEPNGQSATASVKTADGALEITSHFMLDESGKTLIIERRFSNLSKNPITLERVQDYVDPKLIVGGQPMSNSSEGLAQVAVRQTKAGRSRLRDCGGVPSKCPVGPICPRSCRDSDFTAQLHVGQKGITLQWPKATTLEPLQPKAQAGVARQSSPASEVFFVVHVILR